MPPFVGIYYSMLGYDGCIPPTQDEFVDRYLDTVRVEFIGRGTAPAIRYRAQRAYPSFVRQHHAELALRDAFPWTLRSSIIDRVGVDLLVLHEYGALGIALSVDTPTSRAWSDAKAGRNRNRKAPFPILPIYCEPREKEVGQFWLHDPDKLVKAVTECIAYNHPTVKTR